MPLGHGSIDQSSRLDSNQRPPPCEGGEHSRLLHETMSEKGYRHLEDSEPVPFFQAAPRDESGRQESNLLEAAYQTAASPPSPRPDMTR